MYIEDRLFSENNPEEVFFSVTMTEAEYSLYSEFQKEFANLTNKALKNKKLISNYLSSLTPKERQLKNHIEYDKLLGEARRHSMFGLSKKMAKSDLIVNEINKRRWPTLPRGLYTAMDGFPNPVYDPVAQSRLINLKNALKSNKFKGKFVDTNAFMSEIKRID
jgi:hypothetical protein